MSSILILLTLLAVAWAQVFGVQRGFLCEHHGAPMETGAARCELHHEGEAAGAEDDDAEDADEGCDHDDEEHAPLLVELRVSADGGVASSLPAWVAVLECVLTWLPAGSERVWVSRGVERLLSRCAERPPPVGVEIASCVRLLI